VFELLGKLAGGAGSSQPNAPATSPLAPVQTALPTEVECIRHCQERPMLFFFEPHGVPANSSPATITAAAATAPAPLLPSQWPAELSAVQLAAPTTSVKALFVTPAEDDVAPLMSNSEVWGEWPHSVGGWQLCPMSHLCAMVRCKATKSAFAAGLGTVMTAASYGGLSSFFLLASRYELIGTSAVYERYLLLAPNTTTAGATSTTSISVHELRAMRRVACLCRCFCTNGCEVQPRAAGGGVSHVRKDVAPPLPPADYFLRLVPTSLQYTFCFTTTALLSVAEEERCQGWAAATAQLCQQVGGGGGVGGCRHRSCSTEAANTSGALSDGGHTVYQDSSFSRERSMSAVRVVDGVAMIGYSEGPRSATSTPARPSAVSRLDEQQQQESHKHVRRSAERTREAELESRLPQSQRWRALSLLHLVDTSYYDDQVPAGWRRWRYASSGILCRPLVVDSLDGIVRYIHGSRLAFYTAVAFLDRFIAATVDPIANYQVYRRQIYRSRTGQEMDFSMMAGSGAGGPGSSDLHDGSASSTRGRAYATECHSSQLQHCGNGDGDGRDVHARDICGFLTQVIVVCIMLGSKTVDLYPPRIRQLMGCVEDTAPISEQEFVILELHVLMTLGFPVHPVTLFESVNTLLTFAAGDALFATLTASHTTRRLLEEYQDRGHLVDDVDKLLLEQEERDAVSAVRGRGAVTTRAQEVHGCGADLGLGSVSSNKVRPTELLTHADRQAMNSWLRLRLFAYFICDEVIRADATGSSSASSSNANSPRSSPHSGEDDGADHDSGDGWGDGCNVLQFAPALVATAALVTAAQKLCLPLPAPLLRLLPQHIQDGLRDADTAASDALHMQLRFGVNEESNSLSRDATSPLPRTSPVESLCLTAQPTDDHYKVLEELSLLLEAELLRLSAARRGPGGEGPRAGLLSPYRDVEAEETAVALTSSSSSSTSVASPLSVRGGEAEKGGAHCRRAKANGSTPCEAVAPRNSTCTPSSVAALPRADPSAVELMGHVIHHVKMIHERSRESCPPVLLQRYQPLFREGV
jgi:hypothetical protein